MNAAEFWNDAKAAQKVIQESKVVRAQVEPLEDAIRLHEDSKVGYELAKEAGDRDMLAEVDETLFGLQAKMDKIPWNAWDVEAGFRGYCHKFEFICHDLRACQAWEEREFEFED